MPGAGATNRKEKTMSAVVWGKGNKIEERVQGNFILRLDKLTMQALVSMVRLEVGSGWVEGGEEAGSKHLAKAGQALLNAINRIW